MTAASLLALFGLCSCFQMESTITVNKDGSGTITEEMVFGEQMQAMIKMAEAQGAGGQNPFDQMMDKAKAEARAKEMGEGVELVGVEKISKEGQAVGVRTTFKFADINKLKYSSSGAMDMGNMPGMEKKGDGDTPVFKLEGNKLTIAQQKPAKAEEDGKPEVPEAAGDMAAQQMEMMKGMMKDMRITMRLKVAPGIAKTDASHVDGDTITFADIQMGKLLENPEKFKALQKMDDPMKAGELLKGVEGVKVEPKEVVTVEMK